jgi:hypothetical protein
MRRALLVGLMVACLFLPVAASAGTLENQDLQEYKYELIGADGYPISNGIIYGESVLYGICEMGCWVRLVDTGQTIAMKPGQYIIIEDGVMRPKEF